jgi:hypothetical protein
MSKKVHTFSANVWVYPGVGGWHFVYLPKDIAKRIDMAKPKKVGFCFIPVSVTVGDTCWKTTLFPAQKENTYLLALKASVRKKEMIHQGDTIQVSLNV